MSESCEQLFNLSGFGKWVQDRLNCLAAHRSQLVDVEGQPPDRFLGRRRTSRRGTDLSVRSVTKALFAVVIQRRDELRLVVPVFLADSTMSWDEWL